MLQNVQSTLFNKKKIPTKEKINVQKISWILEMNCSCSIM